MISESFSILISAGLTLMAFSILYRENRAFRIAEYMYVGAGTGYGVVLSAKYVYDNVWIPVTKGQTVWLLPLLFSLPLYFYFSKKHSWIYRIPMAAIIGVGTGVIVAADFKSRFTEQIRMTILPLFTAKDLYGSLNNIIIVFGVLGALMFFYFSREPKGPVKALTTYGKYILMATFGAAFGQSFMGRLSLVIGRFQTLFEWPAWILILIAFGIMTISVMRDRSSQKKPGSST
jgi:hypothetical protein